MDPEAAMQALGWVAFFALAALAVLLFVRHVVPESPGWATLLGAVVALCPVLVSGAASGMETTLYAALVLATLLAALERGTAMPLLAAVLMTLAALTRLEAVALAPVVMIIMGATQRSMAAGVRFAAVFGSTFALYFVARALHFGSLFPNVFYAKVDYGDLALLQRGAGYVADFAVGAAPVVALGLWGVALLGRAPRWVRAFAALVAAQVTVVAWEGGDHLALFRFLAPAWVPLCALAAFPLVRVASRLPQRRGPLLVVGLGVLAVAAAEVGIALRPMPGRGLRDPEERAAEQAMSQLERFSHEARLARGWSRMGRALRRAAPRDASLATVAIGAIGFHSDLTIIDPHGLVFPEIAHGRRALGKGFPGHEKFDVEAVLARKPDYLLLVNLPTWKPVPAEELPERVWGEFSRRMVRHPALAEDYTYHAIAFGRRWVNLHVRRGSLVPEPLERNLGMAQAAS
jgi:hypothetical protein